MITVTAPTCLMYVSTSIIADQVHYCCLPLEGRSRLVDNNLFIDDPAISAHEHYLVHGKMTGGITVGCQGFTNCNGKTMSQVYGYPGAIIATEDTLTGNPYGPIDPYGKPYPDDVMTYYFVIQEKDGCKFALMYWINYQYSPDYTDAPYWVQCLTAFCVGPKDYYGQYALYGVVGHMPNRSLFKTLDSAKSAIQKCLSNLKAGNYYRTINPKSAPECFYGDNTFNVTEFNVQNLPDIRNMFRFQEYEWIPKGMSNISHGDSYSFQHLRQSAFWDAISDLKSLNQNSLQTIVEVLQFLKKVKSGKFKLEDIIPGSLSDLWLRYRYQFSTTKSDVEEALEFIQWTGIMDQKDTFFVHGAFTYNGIKCVCKVTVKNRFLSSAKQIWANLYKYGLQPNFYVVWDFTPFSFIVDWFLPVGDLCSIIDQYNHLSESYDCVNVVYSLSYGAVMASGGASLSASLYSRWVENHFPPCEFCYLYDGDNPSDKTILFRCIDTASLILGRK